MKRSKLAVEGSSLVDELRLELGRLPNPNRLQLELLHEDDESVADRPTYARVFRARVGQDGWWVPVAVKLQRDLALSREHRTALAAKFNAERVLHVDRLQKGLDDSSLERMPVVRQLNIWPSDGTEAGILKPCIVCAHARHAIKPRCIHDDGLLAFDEIEHDAGDPRLSCQHSGCNAQYSRTSGNKAAILEATVQKDAACEGCQYQRHESKEACLASATFLAFFPSRILIYELLDLDLHDFLNWRKHGPPVATVVRDYSRRRFAEHRAMVVADLPTGSRNLLEMVEMFSQILAAIEFLHRKGVAHIDLKPHNICLRIRGSELIVKVIDLGLADDPEMVEYLRKGRGVRALWTDFAASEVRNPRVAFAAVAFRCVGQNCHLVFDEKPVGALDPDDPLFCLGDRVELIPASNDRSRIAVKIIEVREKGRSLEVLGEILGPPCDGAGKASIVIDKSLGRAADLFSLGMILLALLVDETELEAYRKEINSLSRVLQPFADRLRKTPGRELVRLLRGKQERNLPNFCAFADRLNSYGSAKLLADELLGIVLRCTLRLPSVRAGSEPMTYLGHRGDDAEKGLKRLRRDVDAVRTTLATLEATRRFEAVRTTRKAKLDWLRKWLADQPEAAAAKGREPTLEY
ncbi:MAG: protein kinase, partial [Planctomycetota bacterium]